MCDERCRILSRAPGASFRVVNASRRDFLTQSTLAGIAALLAACGDGEIGGVGPVAPPVLGTGFVIRIADFPALQQVGGIARVDGRTSNPIAVARTGNATFVALSMICPHAGYKPIDIISGGFRCPNHNAVFASDGNWISGQRTRDLQAYPTTYNAGAGTLAIG